MHLRASNPTLLLVSGDLNFWSGELRKQSFDPEIALSAVVGECESSSTVRHVRKLLGERGERGTRGHADQDAFLESTTPRVFHCALGSDLDHAVEQVSAQYTRNEVGPDP